MKKFSGIIRLVVLIVILVLLYLGPFREKFPILMSTYFPCRQPIAYTIGSFDTRFNISQEDFLEAVREAEDIWEQPIDKELFVHTSDGGLKINLIYDNRQAATVKLQALGLTVSDSQASYDALKVKYNALKTEYAREKAGYDSLVRAFVEREKSYSADVSRANIRGGAKRAEYERLTALRTQLETDLEKIHQLERTLSADVDDINVLVVELNRVAAALNLNVEHYNQIGATRGEEFDEGVYQSGPEGQSIDIYQYDTRTKLVRVLAHEFGHALGLEHLEDAQAIMYRLNQGTNERLTTNDLAALKVRCGIK